MNDFTDLISDNLNKKNEDNITIFDIGCFQGNFSRTIKKKINSKNTNFFLFDPNINLKISDFEYYKLAFSNKQEMQNYYLNDFFPSSGSSLKTTVKNDWLWNFTRKLITMNFSKSFTTYKVKTDTLDSFCSTKNINQIDVLKIDVEGSELDVLLGARKILVNTNIIQIEILELKNKFNDKFSKLVSLLENNYNFKLVKQKNIWSLGMFSKMKAKDVLFVKVQY